MVKLVMSVVLYEGVPVISWGELVSLPLESRGDVLDVRSFPLTLSHHVELAIVGSV